MEVDCINNSRLHYTDLNVLILVVMEVDCINNSRLHYTDLNVLILVVMEVDCINYGYYSKRIRPS